MSGLQSVSHLLIGLVHVGPSIARMCNRLDPFCRCSQACRWVQRSIRTVNHPEQEAIDVTGQSNNTLPRREDVEAIAARPKAQVLIIGGGINGISTFRDLALQGIDVVLVER